MAPADRAAPASEEEVDPLGHPAFGTDESRRVRRARRDGFTGPKQAVFLEGIADGLTVEKAAKAAGISPQAVHNFRNRRAGRAFNIAWEAACRRARCPLADKLHDRSLEGQTETFRDKDQFIVATKHRHDNRLAMAMLTRLDRKAEAYKEDERLVTAVAEEFEELLDVIETEGNAEAFINSRRPVEEEYRPQDRAPDPDEARLELYYRRRSPAEAERLPDDRIDPYPDSAHRDEEEGEGSDEG